MDATSKHGDPRILSPRLTAWLEFFNVIAPYCTTPQTLDHNLIAKICEDYQIPFTTAFEKLSMILKIYRERENEKDESSNQNEGVQRSGPGTET